MTSHIHLRRHHFALLLIGLLIFVSSGTAQVTPSVASVPVFNGSFTTAGKTYRYTMAGRSPKRGGTTVIPTVIVPIALAFDGYKGKDRKELVINASGDVSTVASSPIFQKYAFATGDTQYGDAVQRAEFYDQIRSQKGAKAWHTLLGQPRIAPVLQIDIPTGDGYVLTSKRTGRSLAVVDVEVVKKAFFDGLAKIGVSPSDLIIGLAQNTMFYPLHDATVCCSWGAYGAQFDAPSKSAQAFILGSYLEPGVVPRYSDVQTLSEQVAQWMNDPLQGYQSNKFPAWREPNGRCGGRGEGTFYRFAEPADSPSIPNATRMTLNGAVFHLENAALLPWFAEDSHPRSFQRAYSFPNVHALAAAAEPCPNFRHGRHTPFTPTAQPVAATRSPNGHELIGYWAGYSSARTFPLRDVSPQWDVVIVAFAPPAKGSTSLMVFRPPIGYTADQFKADIAYLQGKGKKVLISLGGGGQVVTLNTPDELRDFVASVSQIVQTYNFNGIDLDFETPSLILQPGDTDFRKPTTPSVVNLISAMRQLHQRFGPGFMIAEVPEGPQVPAGMEVYAGQFGSFLPVIYGTRKILAFVDVQNYNTPPLGGLDGNYYMPGTADYYVAMTELLLHGFPVGRNPNDFFPPLPPEKVAIGFITGGSSISAVEDALLRLIKGEPYGGSEYELQQPRGYPDFNGAMLWNIQADRRENYRFSNAIGPLLHDLPPIGIALTGGASQQKP